MKRTGFPCARFAMCLCFFNCFFLAFAVPGEDCSDPLIIYSLPFADNATTVGRLHDLSGSCATDNGAPDMVYAFMPETDMLIDISLLGSAYDTVLYVFQDNCTTTPIACNDDYFCPQSRIDALWVQADTLYLIVVDGYDTQAGSFTIIITPAGYCDDDDACTEDIYNPVTGLCEHTMVVCNDGNPLTTDMCDSNAGCIFTCGTDDPLEDNDDLLTATPVLLWDESYAWSLAGDDDYFVVTLAAGTAFDIYADFINAWGDIDIALLDDQGTVLAASQSTDDQELISWTAQYTGDYYILVLLYDGSCNEYRLSVLPHCDPPTVHIDPVQPLTGSNPVIVTGTASDPDLTRWTLRYTDPVSHRWVELVSAGESVTNDMLAWWDITGLPPGPYTLELTAEKNCSGRLITAAYVESFMLGFTADLNRDYKVDLQDFVILAEQWLQIYQEPVINEIYYDQPGEDGTDVFIELWGPPGLSLMGFKLRSYSAATGELLMQQSLDGATIGDDGYLVIADTNLNLTLFELTDLIAPIADLQNSPAYLQLVFGEIVVDMVGYGTGPNQQSEGSPAQEAVPGLSLNRSEFHADTDDNSQDFAACQPSPRANPVTCP